METLWLLTRAWNMGITLYSLAQYSEAEKWCSLAMSFVRHLGSLQESYKTQVQNWWRGGGWSTKRWLQQLRSIVALHCSLDTHTHTHTPNKPYGGLNPQPSLETFQSQDLLRFNSRFWCTYRCLVSTVKSSTGWTKPRRTSSWKNNPRGAGQLLSACHSF